MGIGVLCCDVVAESKVFSNAKWQVQVFCLARLSKIAYSTVGIGVAFKDYGRLAGIADISLVGNGVNYHDVCWGRGISEADRLADPDFLAA